MTASSPQKGGHPHSLPHVCSFLLFPAFVQLSRVNHTENCTANNNNSKLHFQPGQADTSFSSAWGQRRARQAQVGKVKHDSNLSLAMPVSVNEGDRLRMPQVPTTVVHKTECEGQAVASSGLQGVLRKDVTVSLALCEYSSAELPVCIQHIPLSCCPPLPIPTHTSGTVLAHLHEDAPVLGVGVWQGYTWRLPSLGALSGIHPLWCYKEPDTFSCESQLNLFLWLGTEVITFLQSMSREGRLLSVLLLIRVLYGI